mmetsp:Transcript_14526/g.32387  ORF Transcript_14526/g.32387 Transcript_14526/m.32387 type:complete len:83 (+) Transcript_14526:469-717(+)
MIYPFFFLECRRLRIELKTAAKERMFKTGGGTIQVRKTRGMKGYLNELFQKEGPHAIANTETSIPSSASLFHQDQPLNHQST